MRSHSFTIVPAITIAASIWAICVSCDMTKAADVDFPDECGEMVGSVEDFLILQIHRFDSVRPPDQPPLADLRLGHVRDLSAK